MVKNKKTPNKKIYFAFAIVATLTAFYFVNKASGSKEVDNYSKISSYLSSIAEDIKADTGMKYIKKDSCYTVSQSKTTDQFRCTSSIVYESIILDKQSAEQLLVKLVNITNHYNSKNLINIAKVNDSSISCSVFYRANEVLSPVYISEKDTILKFVINCTGTPSRSVYNM
jgi:hypothetical protein